MTTLDFMPPIKIIRITWYSQQKIISPVWLHGSSSLTLSPLRFPISSICRYHLHPSLINIGNIPSFDIYHTIWIWHVPIIISPLQIKWIIYLKGRSNTPLPRQLEHILSYSNLAWRIWLIHGIMSIRHRKQYAYLNLCCLWKRNTVQCKQHQNIYPQSHVWPFCFPNVDTTENYLDPHNDRPIEERINMKENNTANEDC